MARTKNDMTPSREEVVIGAIRNEDFSVIMSQAFATYGLSVVTERALPDARDGLKPVQRRILAGMREARYLSSRPTVKSAEASISTASTPRFDHRSYCPSSGL